MPEFDKAFLQQAENDVKNLYNLYTNDRQETLKKVSIDEIATTVKSLKNGKSLDERHISAEHPKYGGRKLLEYLTVLVNWIFENLQIPKTLKSGIACPILKKGKPAHDPNSYRKITITSLIGKVIEKIHLTRNSNAVTEQQNKLQKGFTQGEMPIIAALILSELIAEAKSNKSPLYVAFMDARKAFDVVWHTGLFRDLYIFGITGDNWLFFKHWYENVASKVRWKQNLSDSINELQGVRQGGVWSPTAYKIFINSLLDTLERNQLGAYLGIHYCVTPTVADDVTLISNDPYELQSMLDIQTSHANSKRYLISEQKSSILTFNCTKEHKWYLNNKEMSVANKATHLGIERISTGNNRKELVQTRITTARRTVFALMGAGLHGLNGVNPKVAIHLIQIYVMPRLLYGLEITTLRHNEIQKLEIYFKKLLKQVQNLPERTANEATYLMMGRIPVVGELHKRILKTFGNIIRKDNSIEKDIALRQLAMKGQNSDSWFSKLDEISEKYSLNSPHDLIVNLPTKSSWNRSVGTTINEYYINQMVKDAENKSSLKFLHLTEARYGHFHNIWSSCGTEPFAVTMAAVKVKLATGTLTLQEHKAKFARKGEVSSLCPMCKQETENTAHFILQCVSLQEVRKPFMDKILSYLETNGNLTPYVTDLLEDQNMLQLLIDCTKFDFIPLKERSYLETLSRGLCYKLYLQRLHKITTVA